MAYKPPFAINDATTTIIADIAQKVGKVETYEQLTRSPQLRRENRIKTIHSSLAIENNTLSIEQVTAIVDGKHVLAPAKDLLEVQNAVKVYDSLDSFDPCSVDDLLAAHRLLMGGLVTEAGRFRSGDVGVFDGDKLIHMGTPSAYVPQVIGELFDWLRSGSVHPLVASCVFHYEFEFIHPFADGNGRMGRLWQTLILSCWNSLFAWLPVESLVKESQERYYAVLGRSDAVADCTEFVDFMLGMIDAALDDVLATQGDVGMNVGINVGITNKAEARRERLLVLLREYPTMTMAQMSAELGVSKRQVERLVTGLKAEGRLMRIGANRNGHWKVVDTNGSTFSCHRMGKQGLNE